VDYTERLRCLAINGAQIADHLRVSIPVARARMHAAYTALGTSSRRGAVTAAQERGLLP
jgi:ATP/maltotriose-dependent transcriptional regulator MalT